MGEEHPDGTGAASGDAGGAATKPHETAAASRPVLMFAVVALALFMSSLDQTIVATALHTLEHDLGAPITWTSWTMTIYSLGLVLMFPVAGKLSERYGRRRVFMLSVAVFSTASLCCGLVDNIYALVTLRFLQALGGAGFTPSATAIIVDHFGPARDKAVGLVGSIFPIGAMAGPIFGGLFITYWSWRGIFFVNVPIGILLLVACRHVVPPDAPRAARRHERFDFPGMAQLGIGVLGIMLALNELAAGSGALTSSTFLIPVVVAAVSLAWFGRHTATAPHPFILGRFIAGRGFGAVNLLNVIYGGFVQGLIALVPLYATDRYGISVLGSGTLLTAEGAAIVITSTSAAFLLRRTGYRRPIYVGAAVIIVGMLALSSAPHGLSAYAWLAVSTAVIGLGAGWLSPASRNAGLQLAPDSSSTLAALRSMSRQLGTILTISVTTAIIAGAANPGVVHGHVYAGWAVLMLVMLPLIARIPEHRGAW
ncbi:MAG TPA: MFS transporter [Nevskiaceae bacterium]